MYTGSEIAEMSQLATQYKWYVYNFSHYTGWYVHIICVQCSIQNSKHIAASSKAGSVQTLASQHYDCLPSNKQFGYVKTSAVMASQTTVFQKCLGNHLLVVKVMEWGLQNLVFNLEYYIHRCQASPSVWYTQPQNKPSGCIAVSFPRLHTASCPVVQG